MRFLWARSTGAELGSPVGKTTQAKWGVRELVFMTTPSRCYELQDHPPLPSPRFSLNIRTIASLHDLGLLHSFKLAFIRLFQVVETATRSLIPETYFKNKSVTSESYIAANGNGDYDTTHFSVFQKMIIFSHLTAYSNYLQWYCQRIFDILFH